MRPERVGADHPHQHAGHHEHADLQSSHCCDRQAKPQNPRNLPQHAATDTGRYRSFSDQHIGRKAGERQPLHDGGGASRPGAAQGREIPMPEDQHPIENEVKRHRHDRHDHHDAGAKGGGQLKTQHSRREKTGTPQQIAHRNERISATSPAS